ncbi:MAG: CDP-alcohol phosphatidyltransferase family protein [Solirubrobacteraceae bacterium]
MSDRQLTDGELWAREELALLRAARWAPSAAVRFLLHSQQRASAQRALRPATAARIRAWTATGAATWIALAAADVPPFRHRLREGATWWAASAVMLDWHIGMLETVDGQPRNLGVADALTLVRAWLVPVVADTPTAAIVLVAAATDVLDGAVARATAPTRAGRDLEGLVDACFAAAALRGATRRGLLPRGAARLELARLGAGFAYSLVVYFGRADAPDPAVVRAARLSSPARAGGLILAALGRRRPGAVVLAGGSLWSIAAVAGALLRR